MQTAVGELRDLDRCRKARLVVDVCCLGAGLSVVVAGTGHECRTDDDGDDRHAESGECSGAHHSPAYQS